MYCELLNYEMEAVNALSLHSFINTTITDGKMSVNVPDKLRDASLSGGMFSMKCSTPR